MTSAEIEQPLPYILVFIMALAGLLILLITLIVVLRKFYVRQKFVEPGFGLHHMGFKGEVPLKQVFHAVKDDRPSHIFRSDEWLYSGFDSIDDLFCILGFDPYGNLEYVSAMYRSKRPTQVVLVRRYPNPERIYDGYFAIGFEGETDHLVNFSCPVYRVYQLLDLPKMAVARLALFPYRVRVFQNEAQIKNFKMMYPTGEPDSIQNVSDGIYSVWKIMGQRERWNKAYTYACGRVLCCEKRRNEVTGRKYYAVTIDTGKGLLEIPSKRRAYWRLPREGEYMAVEGEMQGYIEKWTDVSE